MKPLATSFTKQGFRFEQVKRIGNLALFRKRKMLWPPDAYSFEVVRVQQHKERTIAGVKIPAAEALPSSEAWGTDGFTYSNLGSAYRKFNSLLHA